MFCCEADQSYVTLDGKIFIVKIYLFAWKERKGRGRISEDVGLSGQRWEHPAIAPVVNLFDLFCEFHPSGLSMKFLS